MGDVTLSMTIFCIQSVVECADKTGDWRSEAHVLVSVWRELSERGLP